MRKQAWKMSMTLSLVRQSPPGHRTHADSTCACSARRPCCCGHVVHQRMRACVCSKYIPSSRRLSRNCQQAPGSYVKSTCRILNSTTSSDAGSVASNLHCVIASAVLCIASAMPCRATPAEYGQRASGCVNAQAAEFTASRELFIQWTTHPSHSCRECA